MEKSHILSLVAMFILFVVFGGILGALFGVIGMIVGFAMSFIVVLGLNLLLV